MGGGGLLACAAWAGLAGAWTWVQLGVAGVLPLVALGLLIVARERRGARRAALVLVLIALLRVVIAVGPGRGEVRAGAPIRCRFIDAPADARTWFAGIPERETVAIGARFGLSEVERGRHLDAIDLAYSAIEDERALERTASPLIDAWVRDSGQYWLAVPEGRGPFPLVVFLHGNGGSFQFYPHLLARPAIARGLAIAFPAAGMGTYPGTSASELVARTIAAVGREAPIDASRVALVGLSAGVAGSFQAALDSPPGRFRGIVFVSGVFPPVERVEPLRGTRLFVLHGVEDPRAPWDRAQRTAEWLRGQGIEVDVRFEEGADHLALLARRETWVPMVLDWAQEVLK